MAGLQTRNYEGQDGKRVYVTEVVAESVQFLEPKGSSSGGRGDYGASFGGAPQAPSFGNSPQNQPTESKIEITRGILV